MFFNNILVHNLNTPKDRMQWIGIQNMNITLKSSLNAKKRNTFGTASATTCLTKLYNSILKYTSIKVLYQNLPVQCIVPQQGCQHTHYAYPA